MQTSQPNRRLIISCLVILFVMCICLSLASILGAGIIYFTQTSTTSTSSEPPIPENEVLPASVDQQLTEIESQIVELRGWKPQSDVVENFLSPEELRQHVLDDFRITPRRKLRKMHWFLFF
jgi:Flp pilus assembly protein CpaB